MRDNSETVPKIYDGCEAGIQAEGNEELNFQSTKG